MHLGKRFRNLTRAIGGSIIDDDDFKAHARLGDQRLQTLRKARLFVAGGNYYRDQRRIGGWMWRCHKGRLGIIALCDASPFYSDSQLCCWPDVIAARGRLTLTAPPLTSRSRMPTARLACAIYAAK